MPQWTLYFTRWFWGLTNCPPVWVDSETNEWCTYHPLWRYVNGSKQFYNERMD